MDIEPASKSVFKGLGSCFIYCVIHSQLSCLGGSVGHSSSLGLWASSQSASDHSCLYTTTILGTSTGVSPPEVADGLKGSMWEVSGVAMLDCLISAVESLYLVLCSTLVAPALFFTALCTDTQCIYGEMISLFTCQKRVLGKGEYMYRYYTSRTHLSLQSSLHISIIVCIHSGTSLLQRLKKCPD